MGPEQVGRPGIAGYDETRIVITVKDIGYTGFEAEEILRMRYNVQVELADLFNVVALIAIGDTAESVNRLVTAVTELAREDRAIDMYAPTGLAQSRRQTKSYQLPPIPEQAVSPREAFVSEHVEIAFRNSAGRICAEMVTPYPPGIPILCPGERISKDIIDYVRLQLRAGARMQGPVDGRLRTIRVLAS